MSNRLTTLIVTASLLACATLAVVSGTARALPEPQPLLLECLSQDGSTIVYPATEERPEECIEALAIQLSVSPNPPKRSDVVTFSFTVAPGPTDCYDSFGNIFNDTSGTSFQRGITDQSDPFYWEVTCFGNGLESRRITIDIADESSPPPAPATCSDGIDNEGDGYIDWGVDPDCLSAADAEDQYNGPSPPPAGPCPYQAPVKLYRDSNGGGDCWPFAEGQHDAVGLANDHASYIWIESGYQAVLCTDIFMQGACSTVTASSNAPWGAVPNDSVSSLRVERVTAPPPPPAPSCSGVVVLYEHVNYGGRCWSYDVGEYPSLGTAEDQASSIRVASGYFATVFADPSFAGGRYTTETSADAGGWTNVGHGASSLVVFPPERIVRHELLTTAATAEAGPKVEPIGSQSPDARGCWKVWDGFSDYAQNSRRVFTMKLTVNRFCTNGWQITSISGRERFEERPSPPFPFSLVFGWELKSERWEPGDTPSPQNPITMTVLRWDAELVHCIWEKGCPPQWLYPVWIRMELRGNGAAYCSNSWNATVRNCAKVRVP